MNSLPLFEGVIYGTHVLGLDNPIMASEDDIERILNALLGHPSGVITVPELVPLLMAGIKPEVLARKLKARGVKVVGICHFHDSALDFNPLIDITKGRKSIQEQVVPFCEAILGEGLQVVANGPFGYKLGCETTGIDTTDLFDAVIELSQPLLDVATVSDGNMQCSIEQLWSEEDKTIKTPERHKQLLDSFGEPTIFNAHTDIYHYDAGGVLAHNAAETLGERIAFWHASWPNRTTPNIDVIGDRLFNAVSETIRARTQFEETNAKKFKIPLCVSMEVFGKWLREMVPAIGGFYGPTPDMPFDQSVCQFVKFLRHYRMVA